MTTIKLTPRRAALLVCAPLAWALLLLFHPSAERDALYEGLHDEVVTGQIVHAGTLVFIGLLGLALYTLVRDLPGTAAKVSRMAIGPFVLLYGAWETVAGLVTGALVQHANGLPESEREGTSDAIQSLIDNPIVGDPGIVGQAGSLAFIVAAIAAGIAYRRAGAPTLVTVLLGMSVLVTVHPPPFGPAGLVCFAAAAVMIGRGSHRWVARAEA